MTIGQILPVHKFLGVATVTLAAIHTAFIIDDNPTVIFNGKSSFFVAVGALTLLFTLVYSNRIQKLNYKLWHVIHRYIAMGVVILVALHIYWLNDLIQNAPMRLTFLVLSTIILLAISYKAAWKPIRDFWRRHKPEPKVKVKTVGRHRKRGMEYEVKLSDISKRATPPRPSQLETTKSFRVVDGGPGTEPIVYVSGPQPTVEFSRFDDSVSVGRHRLPDGAM